MAGPRRWDDPRYARGVKVPDNRDPARWRVYADWLVDRGNPHGDRLNRMLDSDQPLAGIEDLPGEETGID